MDSSTKKLSPVEKFYKQLKEQQEEERRQREEEERQEGSRLQIA